MPSTRKGMKLRTLPISEKVKILDRIDKEASMQMVCEEFGIKHSTFYDIKKARDKIKSFSLNMKDPGNN